MQSVRWGMSGWALVVIAGVGLSGCGGPDASNPPPATANSAETATTAADEEGLASDLREHHGHHHGGVTRLILESVETLGGTPEQHDKIEKIRADLQARLAPVNAANQNLLGVLADVLADGIASPEEQAKVDAAVAQIATAAVAAHGASADALNQLHGVLDAAQRSALIDKVQAHWQVWREANSADDKDNNGLADAEERRVTHLTKVLGLTPDQVQKMTAALKTGMASASNKLDPSVVDAHLKAFGEAFVKDTFDAKSLSGDSANSGLAASGASRMARFYVVVAPTLTADQRTKLSEYFHKHQTQSQNLPASGT
jgi:Spy/CpxP family protein refolding chaperone